MICYPTVQETIDAFLAEPTNILMYTNTPFNCFLPISCNNCKYRFAENSQQYFCIFDSDDNSATHEAITQLKITHPELFI